MIPHWAFTVAGAAQVKHQVGYLALGAVGAYFLAGAGDDAGFGQREFGHPNANGAQVLVAHAGWFYQHTVQI